MMTLVYKPSAKKKGYLSPEPPIDMRRCRARVSDHWTSGQCQFRGKYEEDGMRWCGFHQPSKVKAKEDKRDAEYRASQAQSSANFVTQNTFNRIAHIAIKVFDQDASMEDLENAVAKWREAKSLSEKLSDERQ